MNRMFRTGLGALALALSLSADPAAAQDHSGHHPPPAAPAAAPLPAAAPPAGEHAGHGAHAAPASTAGPWSYAERDNPPRHLRNRWEMVPAGDGGAFVTAQKQTPRDRCAALLASRTVMIDRATREACASLVPGGGTPAAPAAAPAPPAPHRH